MTRAEADKRLKATIAKMVRDGIDRRTLEDALAGGLVASKCDAYRTTAQAASQAMPEYGITKDNGELVSPAYLRHRVAAHLWRFRTLYSRADRQAVMKATLDDPHWMRRHSNQTVASVSRAVTDHLFDIA